MKNYDIDKILRPAFKLFLTNNYESVSTPKLEQESGLTRGALFYKHKSKAALFRAVVDRYILDFLSQGIAEPNHITLKEYIDTFLTALETRMNGMKALGVENIHRGFYNLMYEALKYYPDFDQKISLFFENGLKGWTAVVQQALDSGEIESKSDAVHVARRFQSLYTGIAFELSLNKGLDVESLREAYDDYYNSLKCNNSSIG